MRTAVRTLLAAAIAVAAAAPAAATPTRHQIARAVAAAERSPSLWATINVCTTPKHTTWIGARGQMPSLGFAAAMSMTITLNAWSTADKKFEPLQGPRAVVTIPLGIHSRRLEQGGMVFRYKTLVTGLWNATIVFTWKRHGTVLGQTRRRTTAGHHDADFGTPPHYSAAECQIS